MIDLSITIEHEWRCRLVREDDKWAEDPAFLREVLLTAYERRTFQTEVINVMPLYPTEAVLWDENQVPSTHYTGPRLSCVALYTRAACLCYSIGHGTSCALMCLTPRSPCIETYACVQFS